jgi:hypothetical protein
LRHLAGRFAREQSSGEEAQLIDEAAGACDEASGVVDRLLSFLVSRNVSREPRVFQFVASSAEIAERPEAVAELGPNCAFDGIVAAVCGRAEALPSEQ